VTRRIRASDTLELVKKNLRKVLLHARPGASPIRVAESFAARRDAPRASLC
jgi:hypothetical protein